MKKKIFGFLGALVLGLCSQAFALDSLWTFGTAGNALSANQYFSVNAPAIGDATVSKKHLVIAGSMTVSNLNVFAVTAPNNGVGTETINYTLYVNGSASALTCSISDASTSCSDSTHTVSLVRGDTVALRAETGAGTPVYSVVSGYIKKTITGTNRDDYIGGPASTTILSGTLTNYTSLFYKAPSTTEVKFIVPVGGNISKLVVALDGTPGAGKSYAVTLRKNGSDTGVTCTVADTNTTCGDLINSSTFAAGDFVSVSIVPSGTPTARYISVGAQFSSLISGYFIHSSFTSSGNPSTSVTHYFPVNGAAGSGTSTSTYNESYPTGLYAMAYYAGQVTAPDNGAGVQSYTYSLRNESSTTDTMANCRIYEALTSCNKNIRVLLPATNYLVHNEVVPSGTPVSGGGSTVGIALSFQVPQTTTIKGY